MSNVTAEAPPIGTTGPRGTKRAARGLAADVHGETDVLDKADVARLSPQQIYRMSRDEMVRAVRAADLPLVDRETSQRLMYCDRETLERLVYLARRCCRNQGY